MPRLFTVCLFVSMLAIAGCASENAESTTASNEGADEAPEYLEDLVITDLVEGEGRMVAAGQRALVHYTVWFRDASAEGAKGQMLQTSKDTGRPYPFMVGNDSVIQAWHQGVPGMKVGGTRELHVPYSLAYGESGRPPGIPPRQDLVFELELVEIQ